MSQKSGVGGLIELQDLATLYRKPIGYWLGL
jgi:hypothetical protein